MSFNLSTPSQKYSSWGLLFENSTLNYMRREKRKPEVDSVWKMRMGKDEPPADSPQPTNEDLGGDGDLGSALRLPLVIGVFLGLIPIRGLLSKGQTQFSWFHWRTLLSASLSLGVGSNIFFITDQFIKILSDTKRQSAGELVFAFSGVWFYTAGTAVYLFFLMKSDQLRKYLTQWRLISKKIGGTLERDSWIRRDVSLLTLLVLGSCVGENILFHFHIMTPHQLARVGEMSFEEFLQDYYGWNKYMYVFFDYHPLIAFALFTLNKLTLYAWNFGDVTLMVLSRALYGQFQGVKKYLKTNMKEEEEGTGLLLIKPHVCWKSVRHNFHLILELLETANEIFAPLIWLSYITNIFFVCNQLYIELSPSAPHDSPLVSRIYVIWSFLHLIMRTIGVNLIGAKINEEAHSISHLLQHCPPEEYDMDIRRLEEYLYSSEIGLTGNGCFVITRSFIIMICSAIFTLEVVLLQSSNVVV